MSHYLYTVKAHATRMPSGKIAWSACAEFTSPVQLHDHEIVNRARLQVACDSRAAINMGQAARTGDVLIERLFIGRD